MAEKTIVLPLQQDSLVPSIEHDEHNHAGMPAWHAKGVGQGFTKVRASASITSELPGLLKKTCMCRGQWEPFSECTYGMLSSL
jgi:hypothetical protein